MYSPCVIPSNNCHTLNNQTPGLCHFLACAEPSAVKPELQGAASFCLLKPELEPHQIVITFLNIFFTILFLRKEELRKNDAAPHNYPKYKTKEMTFRMLYNALLSTVAYHE
jgi:hypothetical protein